jgi:predicted NAD/FAD-binding protein
MINGAYASGVESAHWALNDFQGTLKDDDEDKVFNVVVVGAGAAGLSVARSILDLSSSRDRLDLIVLEACNHIGGRAHTVKLPNPCHAVENEVFCDAGGMYLQQVKLIELIIITQRVL